MIRVLTTHRVGTHTPLPSASSSSSSVAPLFDESSSTAGGVVDPNVKDAKGLTPLHTAVMHNNLAVVKALVEGAGAMIWGQYDEKGLDPRHYAALLTSPSSTASRFGNANDNGSFGGSGKTSVFAPNGASAYRARRRQPPPPLSRVSQYLNSYAVRYRDAKAKGRLFLRENVTPQFYLNWCDRREQATFAAEEVRRVAAEREAAEEEVERRHRHEHQLQIQKEQKEEAAEREATRAQAVIPKVTAEEEEAAARKSTFVSSRGIDAVGPATCPSLTSATTTTATAEDSPAPPNMTTSNTAATSDAPTHSKTSRSRSSSSKAVDLTPREAERQRLQQRLYLAMAGIMTALSGVMAVMVYRLITDRNTVAPEGSRHYRREETEEGPSSSLSSSSSEATSSEWERYDREQSRLAKQWGQQRAAFEQGLYDEHNVSEAISNNQQHEGGVGEGEEAARKKSGGHSSRRVADWHKADDYNHGRGLAGDEYRLADDESPSQQQHEPPSAQRRGDAQRLSSTESAADHYGHYYHGGMGGQPFVYGGTTAFSTSNCEQQQRQRDGNGFNCTPSSSSYSLPHDDPYRPPPPRFEQFRPYFQTPHCRPNLYHHRQRCPSSSSSASHQRRSSSVDGFDAFHHGGGSGEEGRGEGRSTLSVDSVQQWVTGGDRGKAAWRSRVRRLLGRGK